MLKPSTSQLQRRMSQAFLVQLLILVSCTCSMQAQYLGQAPGKSDFSTSASTTPEQTAILNQILNATPPPVHISPGDMLQVKIFNLGAYDTKVRVETEGTAVFPLVGQLPVAGLTVEELVSVLSKKLKDDKMIREPHINILITEAPTQVAVVSGELNKPGNFPVQGKHTLLEMISAAGGMKSTASHTVVLIRPSLANAIPIQLGSNPTQSPYAAIPIFAGDTIIVSSVGVFYVVGAVKNSGVYPLKEATPTTLIQAITIAGGMGYEADSANARLVRRLQNGTRDEIKINIHKVMHGSAEDPILQADDILLMPTDKMKAAVKGGGAGLAVSLASALIYLH